MWKKEISFLFIWQFKKIAGLNYKKKKKNMFGAHYFIKTGSCLFKTGSWYSSYSFSQVNTLSQDENYHTLIFPIQQ